MKFIKICVVGSGPAGFYSVQHLLKNLSNAKVDLYEKLPVPFGLVRYGVAPDHPEVKNVINTFNKTASHTNFNYFGNVSIGCDITLKQLKEAYHIILLTYGAEKDNILGIPGENLDNVLSARQFVGWYNGNPSDQNLKPKLNGETVTILGQGNVAIDVARILLTPIDKLKETDITQNALNTLAESKVKKVNLVGRRGPIQAAFTIKELREMIRLPNCTTLWRETDFEGIEQLLSSLSRPRKRITELMLNSLKTQNQNNANIGNIFSPIFYRAPIDISKSSVKFAKTVLLGDDLLTQKAVLSQEVEFIKSDIVIRSIGYKSINIDPDLPFDDKVGIVKNINGKIGPGIYATGWLAHGPTGVILSTMNNAFSVTNTICEEVTKDPNLISENKPGSELVLQELKKLNKQVVTWKDWEKIDQYEIEEGKKLGKCREKVTDVEKMLKIAA